MLYRITFAFHRALKMDLLIYKSRIFLLATFPLNQYQSLVAQNFFARELYHLSLVYHSSTSKTSTISHLYSLNTYFILSTRSFEIVQISFVAL